MEINRVLLLGNLTQDPETRYLPSGMAVCKLRLASNRRFRDKSGENREETLFINVDVWGRPAENCQQYLRKGSEVLIEGRLKMDAYKTQDGQNRSFIVISADRVQFGRRPGGQGGVPSGTAEEEPMESGEGMTPPPGPSARPSRPAVGGDYRSGASAPRPPAAKPAALAPTWQAQEPADAAPPDDTGANDAPPPDEVSEESGGTNNDLPF